MNQEQHDAAIRTQVRGYIQDNFLLRKGEDLADDISFLDRGLLDSTSVLELVGFLEERFGIRIGDEEMLPENLDSIRAIAAFVRRKEGRP